MSFHDPNYFYWLAALPFIAIIYGFRIYVRQNLITKWLNLQKNFLTSLISEKKRALKMGLRILTMLLLFTALARPQSAGEKVDIYNKGIHLLLLIDVSKSMLAEDIKPNRLSFVQKKISELIDLSSGDQIALGVFASSLLLITPFTNDLTAIKSYLNDLSADYLSNQGTDFGRAFQSSIKIFSDLKDNEREKSVKAVVLVSDGEDHSKTSETTAKILFNKKGVRVFTLSVGTKEGGVIPIRDYTNKIKEYKKDVDGELVITRLKKDLLRKIAKEGRGAYYHLTYGGHAIQQLRKDLDVLEKNLFEKRAYTQKREHYQWFLLMAFLTALMELILSSRIYKQTSFLKRIGLSNESP